MMQAMAVITFSYSCPQEALSEFAVDFATNVKPRIDGLEWKIFLNQPELRRSAGLYCFRDMESAHNYVDGPYIEALRNAPVVREVSTQVFETMEEASLLTGAPLLAVAA
ncbi:MAG: YdhR family protein [Bryobacterales bacterium]